MKNALTSFIIIPSSRSSWPVTG